MIPINTNPEKYEYAGGGRCISKAFLESIRSGKNGQDTCRQRLNRKFKSSFKGIKNGK